MKKRILSAILSVIMCVALLPNMAYAVKGDVTGISYTVTNGTVGVAYDDLKPVLVGPGVAAGDVVYTITSDSGELKIDSETGILSFGTSTAGKSTPKVAGTYTFTVNYFSESDTDSITSPSYTITIGKGTLKTPTVALEKDSKGLLTGKITGFVADTNVKNYTNDFDSTAITPSATAYAVPTTWYGRAIAFTAVAAVPANYNDSPVTALLPIPATPAVAPTITISSDGKFTGTTALMEYSTDNGVKWVDCEIPNKPIKPTDVGEKFIFRVKATGTVFASQQTQPLVATGKYSTPELKIDYVKETLTGLVSGATYELYNADTEVATFTVATGATTVKIESSWMIGKDFTILRVGVGDFKSSDKSSAVEIPKRLAAPTTVKAGVADSKKLTGTLEPVFKKTIVKSTDI